MPAIRLLTDVAGGGPVAGSAGDVLEVDSHTAQQWCDGERAERVVKRTREVETAVPQLRSRPRPQE